MVRIYDFQFETGWCLDVAFVNFDQIEGDTELMDPKMPLVWGIPFSRFAKLYALRYLNG